MSPLSEFVSVRPVRKISLTPLVDIVFILVVFFMLASSFDRHAAMEIAVPGTGNAGDERVLRLDVVADGSYVLAGEAMNLAALPSALRAQMSDVHERPLLVSLDGAAVLQDLVRALDIVRAVGITRVSVVSTPSGTVGE